MRLVSAENLMITYLSSARYFNNIYELLVSFPSKIGKQGAKFKTGKGALIKA